MLGLRTNLRNAQQIKRYLMEHKLFDKRYTIVRAKDQIVFPVSREFSPPFDFDVEFIQTEADERVQAQSLREALQPLLSAEEREELISSYDIVGSIAIIEVPELLASKEALIGEKVLEVNKTVKTVLKKLGGHEGEYRTQRMQCIAGEDTRTTVVTENAVKLKVNVETAYYSIRMATERKRILQFINPGERILCMFSGIGPYPITFSVHSQAAEIVGVEVNPAGHELAVENCAKNRCTNVRLLCGDANDIVPKLAAAGEKFDRITMPLPHTSYEFLDAALMVSKKGTVIHYYAFLQDGDFNIHIPRIRDAAHRHKMEIVKYDVVKAGQHAPRIWRICVDAVLG
jgi:tRNA (guanine37-N1)-methyltransferase